MRTATKEEIACEIEKGKGDFCGIFDPLVIENPFGDRRDKIVRWYQKLLITQKSKRNFIMMFAFFILAITGCKRGPTMGVPGYSYKGTPVLRVHPRSLIEYTDASNFVKHNIYKIQLTVKKEKKKKKIKPTNK